MSGSGASLCGLGIHVFGAAGDWCICGQTRRPQEVFEPVREAIPLRDYFAAAALPGVLTARARLELEMNQESIAEECYELADAMLEARISPPADEAEAEEDAGL